MTITRADQGPEDYSYIWRGAIDFAEDHYDEDIKNILVSALKDALSVYLEKDSNALPFVVQQLEARKWIIFQRLALHLLVQLGSLFPEIVAERLTNHSLFQDHRIRREYKLLLHHFFSTLVQGEQEKILQWINAGPDLEIFVRSRMGYWGKETSSDELEQYRKAWQRDQLFPFHQNLTGIWCQRYNELVQEIGEPEPIEKMNISFTSMGPTSPKNPRDLEEMSNSDLLEFLKTWQSSNDPLGPTPEGLSRTISKFVASRPERFVSDLSLFQELDEPTYVRGLIEGFFETKKENSFDWEGVLNFCNWAVQKPVQIEGRRVGQWGDADPDWGWTRKSVLRLISVGLEKGDNPIPLDLRTQVWKILFSLTLDSTSPNAEDNENHPGSSRNWANLAINTIRGDAIGMVIRYALWLRRHFENLADGINRIEKGFEEMPEVKEVLESHLNPGIDPSLAIRSVYGQWFPWLVLLDTPWTRNNLNKIFPKNETLIPFRQVAWQTYIILCAPYNNVFSLIQDEYAWAIDELQTSSKNEDQWRNPDKHLAQHLMTFYWRGKIDLDSPTNLLPLFHQKASDPLCAAAIKFAGRSLKDTDGPVENDILERFQKYWERRFETIASDPAINSHKKELAGFGWWIASKKFNGQWAIEQLLSVLQLIKQIDPEHLVMEVFMDLVETMPLEVLNCLKLMIDGNGENWHVLLMEREIREILSKAKISGNPQAHETADKIINELGAKGYFGYRDLF